MRGIFTESIPPTRLRADLQECFNQEGNPLFRQPWGSADTGCDQPFMENRAHPSADEQLLGPREVAFLLGVCYKTAVKRMADGTVPAFRLGKLWRAKAGDVRAIGRRDRES